MDMAPPYDSDRNRRELARRVVCQKPLVTARFEDSNVLIDAEARLLDRLIGADIANLFKAVR